MNIVPMSTTLISMTPDAMQLIERAGRTCYKSEDKITEDSAEEFVAMLIKRGHESVLEHASATFRFVCDRGVSHELVRHRIAAYSQESTRYCNYGKNDEITVIEPLGIDDWGRNCWREAMRACEGAYLAMTDNGAAPQVARHVLPISIKTEVVATMNFRQWRHVFRLRTSRAAHPHIAYLMRQALVNMAEACPAAFQDIAQESGE